MEKKNHCTSPIGYMNHNTHVALRKNFNSWDHQLGLNGGPKPLSGHPAICYMITKAAGAFQWCIRGWRSSGSGAHLAHQLLSAVQMRGPERAVPIQRLQQQVLADAGDAVRRAGGLRGAWRSQIGTETLCGLAQIRRLLEVLRFAPRPPITR